MKNCNDEIIRLIQLYLSGELSQEETEELDTWLKCNKRNQAFLDSLIQEEYFSQEFPIYSRIDEAKAFWSFEMQSGRKSPKRLYYQMLKYAAILLLPLFLLLLWQLNRQPSADSVTQAIVPGTAKAILTLAGGKQVNLSKQQLQEEIQLQNGVKVKPEAGILAYDPVYETTGKQTEYNTLATGRGGEYQVVLSDGTRIFLNAATTLKYPVTFDGAIRKVKLEGEAYFEVAKDIAHPFIVEMQGAEVKVYGTSFNINTFRTGEIQTVLIEGKIGVRALASGQEYQVCPGQMAVWKQATASIELKEVDIAPYIAWKEGVFRFANERLEDILTTLSNWYDVEIFYQSQDVRFLHFSGYMERYKNINTILEAITEATGVQFSIQGKTIIVSK